MGTGVDEDTGLLSFTPGAGSGATASFVVRAEDAGGLFDEQAFTVTLRSDTTRPLVSVSATPSFVDPGEEVLIHVTATDDVGLATVTLTVDGSPVALDANFDAHLFPTAAGPHTAIAQATDDAGNEAEATTLFSVTDPADVSPPDVAFLEPAEDTIITAPFTIRGSALDANLVRYELSLAEAGSTTFVPFAEGTTPVSDGILGVLDPTLLENGAWSLRLAATDVNGITSIIERPISIDGNMKVGIFTLCFNDLTIPVSGIPISVDRCYDSRVKTKQDFGFGWHLQLHRGKYQSNRKPGDGWEFPPQNFMDPFFIPCGNPPLELKSHRTEIRLSDREVFTFALRLENTGRIGGGCEAEAVFEPIGGTRPGATLHILGNTAVFQQFFTGVIRDQDTLAVYDPPHVLLTTPEGLEVELDRSRGGIVSITDRNDNTVFILSNGILHSSGKSIFFERDAEGRIKRIIDPMGHDLKYRYDLAGDLVSFKDQEDNETTFTYLQRPAHHLQDIINALGIRATRSEYSDDGRLIATVDPAGNRVTFDHDLTNRREVITDRLGHPTQVLYDPRGNVLEERKFVTLAGVLTPVVRSFTYDEQDNELTRTDPLGHTERLSYNASNNVLTSTDALGHTTTFTYSRNNQILTQRDARGFVTETRYDRDDNPVLSIDALGHSSTTTSAFGNIASTIDPLGNTTRFFYTPSGDRERVINALGHPRRYTFDNNGNQLTETTTRTNELGQVVTIIRRRVYDVQNRVIQEIDGGGFTTLTDYDPLGRVSTRTDANGNRTTFSYDPLQGRLDKITFQDGSFESYTHDAEGRRVTTRDRSGRLTTLELDELGRTIRTIFADGSETKTEHDRAGNVRARIDGTGRRTELEYDELDRQVLERDPLGNETVFAFDSVGNRTVVRDANQKTTLFEYDANRRLFRTTFPDGTFASAVYDAAGRQTLAVDEAGLETRFQFDAVGQPTKVIDALGFETTYGYSEVGDRVRHTDANQHTTVFGFDDEGRRTKHILPLGQTETFEHDGTGNMVARTTFNGATLRFGFDSNHQPVSKLVPGQPPVTITYSPTGQRATVTDGRGTTVYTQDLRDRLVRIDYPDGTFVSYGFDTAGRRTSVTTPGGRVQYTFDLAGRLLTITDPSGGLTQLDHDPVGNPTRLEHPNGVVLSRTIDSRNRASRINGTDSAGNVLTRHVYTFGPTGNRLSVEEHGGRSVIWTYDDLYRLTDEEITDPVAGNRLIHQSYDPVGNRLMRTDGIATVVYSFDENDRLLAAGSTTYNFDASGNVTSKSDGAEITTYIWNAENRLVSATAGTTNFSALYDVDGIRVQREVDGERTRFVIDPEQDFAQVLEERDVAGGLRALYVRGDGLLSQSRSGQSSYYLADGLGSTRALADSAGTLTDAYAFEAFGELSSRTGATENSYLFAGEQLDPELDLYYLRARYMQPSTGRFFGQDPFEGDPRDPLSLHRYLYARNDPANRIDPSGEFSLIELGAVVAIIGILVSVPSSASAGQGGPLADPAVLRMRAAKLDAMALAFRQFDDTRGKGTDSALWWFAIPRSFRLMGGRSGLMAELNSKWSAIFDKIGVAALSPGTVTNCATGHAYVLGFAENRVYVCPDAGIALANFDGKTWMTAAGIWVHEAAHLAIGAKSKHAAGEYGKYRVEIRELVERLKNSDTTTPNSAWHFQLAAELSGLQPVKDDP